MTDPTKNHAEEVARCSWLLDAARVALRDGKFPAALSLIGDAAQRVGILIVTDERKGG